MQHEITPLGLNDCCNQLLKSLETDYFHVACRLVQGSDAWLKERQLRITGQYFIYLYSDIKMALISIKYFQCLRILAYANI